MISKWKVANFKSIQAETELEFRPLTIFAGSNSSGKSTLIQSILLIAQSLAPKVDTNHFVLNGTLTNLGQFDDLISNQRKSDQITIKCTYHPLWIPASEQHRRPFVLHGDPTFLPRAYQIHEIACEISFDADTSNTERDFIQLHPRLNTTQLSCKVRDDENEKGSFDISLKRSKRTKSKLKNTMEPSLVINGNQARGRYEVKLDRSSTNELKALFLESAEPVDCQFKHFLPDELIVEYEVNEAIAQAITQMFQRPIYFHHEFLLSELEAGSISNEVMKYLHELLKKDVNFEKFGWFGSLESDEGTLFNKQHEEVSIRELRAWLRNLPRSTRGVVERKTKNREDFFKDIHGIMKKSSNTTHKRSASLRLPRSLRFAIRTLENFFNSSLKYLGPLRDSPKQLYPIVHAADPYDVGLRGEHSASILELHKDRPIEYIPSKNFRSQLINRKTDRQPLARAVNDWLQYLEVADTVNSKYQNKWGREINVNLSDSKHAHDLTHVGVGVSQVLPILVMCLLADPDSTLVLEQPELHLHPKVQTLLGDFFLSMALCNKQCIVETHSEYLIDGLRLRIASTAEEQELNSTTKIYFVEKTSRGSTFRDVEVNQYGAITNWPQGFFDQSQKEAQEILLAATKKRQEKQKTNRAKSSQRND